MARNRTDKNSDNSYLLKREKDVNLPCDRCHTRPRRHVEIYRVQMFVHQSHCKLFLVKISISYFFSSFEDALLCNLWNKSLESHFYISFLNNLVDILMYSMCAYHKNVYTILRTWHFKTLDSINTRLKVHFYIWTS